MENENNQETTVAEEAVSANENQTPAELSINDLVNFKSIFEIASQRGAFRAGELEMVGKMYNKLAAFLESVSKS